MALNGIRAYALNGIKWHAPLRGGVSFSIPTVEGNTPDILGYRFRYLWLRGAKNGERRTESGKRKAEIWRRAGIVFDTRGYGERRTESGKRKTEIWRRAGIVFDTRGYGGVFPLGWVLFSIPMRAVEISSTGGISLCVSGIVFDTCVGKGVFICGAARATGYRFRYLWGKGAHLTFLGIVFDTHGYGGVFPLGWVLFSIPMWV